MIEFVINQFLLLRNWKRAMHVCESHNPKKKSYPKTKEKWFMEATIVEGDGNHNRDHASA